MLKNTVINPARAMAGNMSIDIRRVAYSEIREKASKVSSLVLFSIPFSSLLKVAILELLSNTRVRTKMHAPFFVAVLRISFPKPTYLVMLGCFQIA